MTSQIDPELLPLYLHLYFDEDVSRKIVDYPRTRGIDVLSALEADMLGKIMSRFFMPFRNSAPSSLTTAWKTSFDTLESRSGV